MSKLLEKLTPDERTAVLNAEIEMRKAGRKIGAILERHLPSTHPDICVSIAVYREFESLSLSAFRAGHKSCVTSDDAIGATLGRAWDRLHEAMEADDAKA